MPYMSAYDYNRLMRSVQSKYNRIRYVGKKPTGSLVRSYDKF